jgi:hypothetical protein
VCVVCDIPLETETRSTANKRKPGERSHKDIEIDVDIDR